MLTTAIPTAAGSVGPIMPPAAELIWGTVTFVAVIAIIVALVVLLVRVLRTTEARDTPLLERALRAEAERDVLGEEVERLRRSSVERRNGPDS